MKFGDEHERRVATAERLVAKGLLRRVRPGTYALTETGRRAAVLAISELPWHLRLWHHASHWFHRALRWLGVIE